jgi:hypothetical protein
MPTSYDGTLLDHLVEHMVYLSTASSFWFSLDSSYNHEFNLSKRLGMSPQAFKFLLVAAQLAHFHKKLGFYIKKLKAKATTRSFAARPLPGASLSLLLLMPHCWHWRPFCWLSPLPFLMPMLFLLPPQLRYCRFFCCYLS